MKFKKIIVLIFIFLCSQQIVFAEIVQKQPTWYDKLLSIFKNIQYSISGSSEITYPNSVRLEWTATNVYGDMCKGFDVGWINVISQNVLDPNTWTITVTSNPYNINFALENKEGQRVYIRATGTIPDCQNVKTVYATGYVEATIKSARVCTPFESKPATCIATTWPRFIMYEKCLPDGSGWAWDSTECSQYDYKPLCQSMCGSMQPPNPTTGSSTTSTTSTTITTTTINGKCTADFQCGRKCNDDNLMKGICNSDGTCSYEGEKCNNGCYVDTVNNWAICKSECNADYECGTKCDGDVLKTNGKCQITNSVGKCVYTDKVCKEGCQNGVCASQKMRLVFVPLNYETSDNNAFMNAANKALSRIKQVYPISNCNNKDDLIETHFLTPSDCPTKCFSTNQSDANADAQAICSDCQNVIKNCVLNSQYKDNWDKIIGISKTDFFYLSGSGIVGCAPGIPSESSITYGGYVDEDKTVTHELGHSFGLCHECQGSLSCSAFRGDGNNCPNINEQDCRYIMCYGTEDVFSPSSNLYLDKVFSSVMEGCK